MIQINWLADYVAWRKWRQAAWFLLIAGQSLDLLTTLAFIAVLGIEAELNPLMRGVWGVAGPFGLLGVKLATVGIFAWLSTKVAGVLWLGAAVGLLLAANNALILVMVAR